MILDVSKIDSIYLAREIVDFRKGLDALIKIVNLKLDLDPVSNSIFVFCNKNRTKIKILYWDGSGWWLFMKRIERGKFSWPKGTDASLTINERQLSWLLQGLKTNQFLVEKASKKEYISW